MELFRNIYLIGPVGVGKSACGKILAKKLEWGFINIDETIEAIHDRPVNEIYEDFGEAAFHSIESEILHEVSRGNHQIITCSDGIINNDTNLKLIKASGMLYFLDQPLKTFAKRLESSDYSFLLSDEWKDYLQKKLVGRGILMQESDVVISTEKYTHAQVADAIRLSMAESGKYQF